jgi:hypothetical protein
MGHLMCHDECSGLVIRTQLVELASEKDVGAWSREGGCDHEPRDDDGQWALTGASGVEPSDDPCSAVDCPRLLLYPIVLIQVAIEPFAD